VARGILLASVWVSLGAADLLFRLHFAAAIAVVASSDATLLCEIVLLCGLRGWAYGPTLQRGIGS